MQATNINSFCVLLTISIFFLSGCAAGSGSGGGSIITGIATAGIPLAGVVTIKDSSTPSKEIVATTRADGAYIFDVAGMKAPFTIEATGPSGGTSYTLHTVANGTGTVNINPLTEVAVSGAAEGDNAVTVHNFLELDKLKKVGDNMPRVLAALGTNLKPLFHGFGITIDAITGQLNASHKSLQALFASVEFIHSNGTLMVVNKATSAVIFTCQINNISGGTFTAGNMPPIPTGPAV